MRKVLVLLVAVGALAVLVQPAMASINVGDTLLINEAGCVRQGNGGEFYVNDQTSLTPFFTFCGDDSHYFSPGSTYKVTDFVGVPSGLIEYTNVTAWNKYLNTLPLGTGLAAPGTAATAASLRQAAWLFDQYFNNTSTQSNPWVPGHSLLLGSSVLVGYTNANIAGAIQDAIWSLEGYAGHWSSTDDQPIATALGWGTFSNLSFDGIGNLAPKNDVVLIELSGDYSPAQGQLWEVPEPATLLIWSLLGASWTGLAVVRRRWNRSVSWSPEARTAIKALIEHGRN